MGDDWRDHEEITELGILRGVIKTLGVQGDTLDTQGRILDTFADFMRSVNRTHLALLVATVCQWGVMLWLAVKILSEPTP